MTRQLIYLDTARDDLADIAIYIIEQSGMREVGIDFVARLNEKCARLAELPGTIGAARPALRADIRSTPYHGYVIYFRYTADTMEIVAILHASRDAEKYFQD